VANLTECPACHNPKQQALGRQMFMQQSGDSWYCMECGASSKKPGAAPAPAPSVVTVSPAAEAVIQKMRGGMLLRLEPPDTGVRLDDNGKPIPLQAAPHLETAFHLVRPGFGRSGAESVPVEVAKEVLESGRVRFRDWEGAFPLYTIKGGQ
jgi:hypothetical protein